LSNGVMKKSHYMMLTSAGMRCKTKSTLSINSVNCGTGTANELW